MRRQEQESARSVQFLLVLFGGGAFCVVLGATVRGFVGEVRFASYWALLVARTRDRL